MDVMEILIKMRVACIAGVLALGVVGCLAQETRTVEDIRGVWIISDDITPVYARAKAIDEAKAEALRMAGVPEYVAESNLLYTTEKDNKINDVHESLISTAVSGEISGFQVIKEEKKINEFGNLAYEVWINATVVLHKTSKDPGFNVDVNGIRDTYRSPEELVFDVMPSKAGYLNIFILADDESLLLYPNKFEKPVRLEGGTTYKFPVSRALDYEVSSEKSMEVNHLVLVYTKTEVPFREKETMEKILHFVATIDPAQKCVRSFSILIKQR
jgi:hypothetical protein